MPRFPTGALNAALLSTFLSRSAASCTASYTAVGINYVQVHSLFLCRVNYSRVGAAVQQDWQHSPFLCHSPLPPPVRLVGSSTPLVCSPMPSRQLGHHFPLKLPPQPPPTAQAPKKQTPTTSRSPCQPTPHGSNPPLKSYV